MPIEFNDGNQYHYVTNAADYDAQRDVYVMRAASANGTPRTPYKDTQFDAQRALLRPRMALMVYYQFIYTDAGSPEAQADFFCRTIGTLAANEAVMVDPETGGGFTAANVADFVKRWLQVVENKLNTKAWVYNPKVLSPSLVPIIGDRIKMAPRYQSLTSSTRGPAPDWPWDIHQYSQNAFFPGANGNGDTNYTELTVDQLIARSQRYIAPPPPAPTLDPNPQPVTGSSYNGWSAGSGWSVAGGQLVPLVVAGESFPPGVRKGNVATILKYLVEQLHARVEPVVRADFHQADDWGYSYRANVNNPSQLSCHASGTAIDYNATRHPNGSAGTFSAAQVVEIRRILTELGGTVRWGGDFTGTKDEMHFEINKDAATVAAMAAKINGFTTEDFMTTPISNENLARITDSVWARLSNRADLDGPAPMADRVVGTDKKTGETVDLIRSLITKVDGVITKQGQIASSVQSALERADSARLAAAAAERSVEALRTQVATGADPQIATDLATLLAYVKKNLGD